MKPTKPTKEERAQQIARFFSQKREQYFQIILANMLQNPTTAIGTDAGVLILVEQALKAADHAIGILYPLPEEEGQ